MRILMDSLYDNLNDAKAFQLSFTNFVHIYEDACYFNFTAAPCPVCDRAKQNRDYLIPKANCKKPCGILSYLEFGVSPQLRDELIARFSITEADFRPIRTKRGEIVYYQITPKHTMLPIARVNRWVPERPCPQCGYQEHTHQDFENDKGEFYHYITQEALDEMQDLNVTFESFHDAPLVVVSRRVYDFWVEMFPRTHFIPFFLAE